VGQLDDAIREHLELKRLRGADPHELSLQEREALGAATCAGEPLPQVRVRRVTTRRTDAPRAAPVSTEAAPAFEWEEPPVRRPDPVLDQETAELDMQAVLAGQPSASVPLT
jgi:hypothetical protein